MPLEQVIKSLEEVIAKSPLSKMWVIDSMDNEPLIVSTWLFARREDMEKAKTLEIALANGVIETEQCDDEFPRVPYIEVAATYKLAEVRDIGEGSRLSLWQDAIFPDLSMRLCIGSKMLYVADDDKYSGNVLLRVHFSQEGIAYMVHNSGLIEPPLIREGASAVEAFKALEDYITKTRADS